MILHVVVAIAIGLVILWLGIKALRVASAGGRVPEKPEVEDVDELDVYFVCANCGTEFRVCGLSGILRRKDLEIVSQDMGRHVAATVIDEKAGHIFA